MRFKHLRRISESGEPESHGGITIAYDTVGEGAEEDVIYSFAVCSKKDRFCKQWGRDISEARWDKFMRKSPERLFVARLNGRGPIQAILDQMKESVINGSTMGNSLRLRRSGE